MVIKLRLWDMLYANSTSCKIQPEDEPLVIWKAGEDSGEVPDILRRLLDWMLSSRGSTSKMEPGSVLHTFRSSDRKEKSKTLKHSATFKLKNTPCLLLFFTWAETNSEYCSKIKQYSKNMKRKHQTCDQQSSDCTFKSQPPVLRLEHYMNNTTQTTAEGR